MKKNKKSKIQNNKNLESLLEDLKKEFGEGSIMTLETIPKINVEVVPTGSPSLDIILGINGLPRGRIIEIYGPESSGKTTLALEAASEVQKQGGNVAFIDTEHALDPDYAKKIGVNIEKMVISQPDSGEDALNITERLVKSGIFDLIIIDSVAALVPRAELEGEVGDQFIGLQARMMSQALRKLSGLVSKTRTIIIFINQTRAMIGGLIPGQETTPGGKALKFYSSIRIELRRIAQIKKGDQIIGNKVRVKIVKNKVAPPFKTTDIEIYYNEGIAAESDLLYLGEKYNVLKKQGNSYFFEENKLGASFQAAKEFLKENPQLSKKIFNSILDIIKKEN